jgi:hypothetical protein
VRRRLIAGPLALVAVTLCSGAHAARAASPEAAPRPAVGDVFRAGAARVPLRVPTGTPVAGYGSVRRRLVVPDVLGRYPHAFWFAPHEGALDDVAARALVMYAGATRVTWIAADLVAVDQRFLHRLAERFAARGIRPGTVIVSASHTHSGPGAYLASGLFGLAALDREDSDVREAVLDAIVEATRRAGAGARDARVAAATVDAPAMTTSRLGRAIDPALVVLKLTTTTGEPLAAVWNYAIHGTMLGPANRRLSGDVMGVATRTFEESLGVPALFVNGAVGDVSPRTHGMAAMADAGRALAEKVRAAWASAEPVGTEPFAVRTARVALPEPGVSPRHCVASWLPATRVPLGRFLPATETELVAVALGRVAWVTMPGEPVTALGREIKDSARDRWAHVIVAGVSNDYLGYFIRPEDDAKTGYVTCAAVYGPRLGACLTATARELLRRLPRPGAAPAGVVPACDFATGAR